MASLLDVPRYLYLSVFRTNWPKLKDVCRLDTALCNKSKRRNFLNSLSHEIVVFEGSVNSEEYLKWLLLRNFYMRRIEIDGQYFHVGEPIHHENLLTCLGRLTTLRLTNTLEEANVMLISMACNATDLEELCVGPSLHVDISVVKAFVEHCHFLRRLTFTDCRKIEDISFESVDWSHLCNLTSLSLDKNYFMSCVSEMTPSLSSRPLASTVLSVSSSTLSKLTFLNVSFGYSLSDECVLALTRNCNVLRVLDLSHVNNITDVVLFHLAATCPAITKLNLDNCRLITDAGLKAVMAALPHLLVVDLSACQRLTAEGFESLARCTALTRLSVNHCTNLTNAAMDTVVEKCTKLNELRLSGCAALSDTSMHSLARHCRLLVSLDVSFCPLLTVEGLSFLLNSVPSLVNLDIVGCSQVSVYSLMTVTQCAFKRNIRAVQHAMDYIC